MPQGKHKGSRVLLTVSEENYQEWKRLAAVAGMPVATLMRETLDMALPSVSEVWAAIDKHRDSPEVMDDVMARLLWKNIKKGF